MGVERRGKRLLLGRNGSLLFKKRIVFWREGCMIIGGRGGNAFGEFGVLVVRYDRMDLYQFVVYWNCPGGKFYSSLTMRQDPKCVACKCSIESGASFCVLMLL
jgi:hypothetical protein